VQPIGVYFEKRIVARRTFRLFSEKIEIKGKLGGGGLFETEIVLKNLRLPKDILCCKDSLSQMILMLPGMAVLIGVVIFGEKIYSHSPVGFWIALAASFAGMILGFVSAKRLKYYRYHHESGFPAFDLSELGNTRESFESFSDLIDKQITESKKI
jgi:hypothetical protein